MPEFQRPADSVLSAPNVADAYNKASLNASMMTSSPPPSCSLDAHVSTYFGQHIVIKFGCER